MRPLGIRAFDTTIHTTNVWLNDLLDRLGWDDKQRAYQALRVVLHLLRDHLPVDEVAGLSGQLPMLIRGIFFEGWHPAGKPLKRRDLGEFLLLAASALPHDTDTDPEDVVRAVCQVIARHVTQGAIDHVCHSLPHELRGLFAEELHTMWF